MRVKGGGALVTGKRRFWRRPGLVAGVFAVALGIRILYLLDIRDNPFFDAPIIDAQYYRDLGLALSRGEGTGRAPFMMPPLYPLLLAMLFRLAGPHLLLAHVLQVVLGAGTAALTALLARRVGGAGVAWVAGLLVATSRALLFLEGDLLATPLAIFLDVLFLLLLLRGLERAARWSLVWPGLCAGLAALAVPTVLASVLGLAVWLVWRRRAAAALVLLASTVVPIVPVTVHNARASGALVWISANGGINFYIGNNPDMRRTVALRPGPEWRRMNDLPLREAGLVHAAARDRWFYARGLRFWRDAPRQALAHTGEKLLHLLHAHERMRDFDMTYFTRHYSRLLRLPSWNFALLLAAAAVGCVCGRRGTARTVLAIFLGSYTAAVLAFFVTARYRAPLLPVLAVFAAVGAAWCMGAVRRRAARPLLAAAALAAAVGTVSAVDWLGQDDVDEVEAIYRVGTAFQQQGDCARALASFATVLARVPDHDLAAAHAAQCEQRAGRAQAAVDLYERILSAHPDHVEAMVSLGNLAWSHGDSAHAAYYYELAVTTEPTFAPAHAYRGQFLLAHAAASPAVAALTRALALDPSWEALRLDLARAYVAARQPERALRELDTALEVMPVTDVFELVRGDALQRLGRDTEARAAWERGLRLNPASAELRSRLRNSS